MFKKTLIIMVLFMPVFFLKVFAADIIIELNFPKRSTARVTGQKPISKPETVSGKLLADISPYPAQAEKDRYTMEYFLDDQLIFSTSGFNESDTANLSFAYLLDTEKYANGEHTLVVNFWDEKAPSAIGVKKIIIQNENVNE